MEEHIRGHPAPSQLPQQQQQSGSDGLVGGNHDNDAVAGGSSLAVPPGPAVPRPSPSPPPRDCPDAETIVRAITYFIFMP